MMPQGGTNVTEDQKRDSPGERPMGIRSGIADGLPGGALHDEGQMGQLDEAEKIGRDAIGRSRDDDPAE